MTTPEDRVAEIVAQRAGKPKPRKSRAKPKAEKPDTVAPTVSDEEKRNPDGTFAKGNPGGPGRPSLAGEIMKVLAETDLATGKPNVYKVALAIVELAKTGSLGHVGVIMERTDGKVAQPISVEVTADVVRDSFAGRVARLAAGAADAASDSESE